MTKGIIVFALLVAAACGKPTIQLEKDKVIKHDLSPVTMHHDLEHNIERTNNESSTINKSATKGPGQTFDLSGRMIKNEETGQIIEHSTDSPLDYKNMTDADVDMRLLEDATVRNGTEKHVFTTNDPHHLTISNTGRETRLVKPDDRLSKFETKTKNKRQSSFFYKPSPDEIEQWKQVANFRVKRENNELSDNFFNDLVIELPVDE